MEYTNGLQRAKDAGPVDAKTWNEAIEALLLMAAPAVPHIAEELWSRTGRPYSIHQQSWPSYDESLTAAEQVTLVVQVNGKVRDRIEVATDVSEEQAKELALASERVRAHTEGKEIARVIYVPGRLVNVVVW
jgi:leucyl-tRNA synthetase